MTEPHNEPVTESDQTDSVTDHSIASEINSADVAASSESALDEAVRERDEFKDIALRVQADFENYRKRAASQMGDELDRALGKLVEQLLPVLDACEAAVTHGIEGVEQVWSSLLGALQKQGLEALDLTGKPFDPSLADAVMHEEGDGSESVVLEVLRTGYLWKGRVLRAAMVKVKG